MEAYRGIQRYLRKGKPPVKYMLDILNKTQDMVYGDLKRAMPNTVRFDLGPASEFVKQLHVPDGAALYSDQHSISPRAPYPSIWLDFSMVDPYSHRSVPAFLMMGFLEHDDKMSIEQIMGQYSPKHGWLIHPILIRHVVSETVPATLTVRLPDVWQGNQVSAEEQSALDDMVAESGFFMTVGNAFLMLMQCKNIEPKEIIPSKSQKKRSKKPLISYHVLTITPTKGQRKYLAQSHKGGVNRLHLCAGHFKTYTAEKPLFGHAVGRYWWQPQARASKKAGVVHKDYKVKPGTKINKPKPAGTAPYTELPPS